MTVERDAELAQEVRQFITERLLAGKPAKEVTAALVARWGADIVEVADIAEGFDREMAAAAAALPKPNREQRRKKKKRR